MQDLHDDIKIPSSGLSTRIALLALLALRPMHGYELRQVMEERHMHRWADVQYGSIYRGLQQLAREGLTEEAGEHREGNRPPRTIYRITEAGREELKSLLRQAWTQPSLSSEPVDIALSFFMFLPESEIVALLEQRIGQLDKLREMVEEGRQRFAEHLQQRIDNGEIRHLGPNFRPKPKRILAMISDQFEHRQRLLAAEREWTEHLLERFKNGAYDDGEAWCEPGTDHHQPPHEEIQNRLRENHAHGHPHRRRGRHKKE